MINRVHVIEPDIHRRARIAHELNNWNVHAEIYQDLTEFNEVSPTDGCVLAADNEQIARAMRSANPLPFVVYSEHPSTETVVGAMRAGALDYLQWPFEPRLLRSAFQHLHIDGERLLHEQQLKAGAAAKVDRLTGRERDVLVRLIEGMSNKGIARALGISHRTVEIHRGHMMTKLGAQSTADAVRIALYAGLDEKFRIAA